MNNTIGLVAVGDTVSFIYYLCATVGNVYGAIRLVANHSYLLKFGDNDTSTNYTVLEDVFAITSHVYTIAGTHYAQLIVDDTITSKPLKVTVCTDPIYTHQICSTRVWRDGTEIVTGPVSGSYILPDTTFAIGYLDKTDISLWGDRLVYSTNLSFGNVLIFNSTDIKDNSMVYYNSLTDSISIIYTYYGLVGPRQYPPFYQISYHSI